MVMILTGYPNSAKDSISSRILHSPEWTIREIKALIPEKPAEEKENPNNPPRRK